MTPDDQIALETAREILAHADARIEETPTPEEGMRQLAYIIDKALARSREQGEEDTAILDWMGIETKFHYTYFRHGEYCAGGISYIPSFAFPIGQKAPPHMTLRELARASMKAAQTPPAARHPEERK